MGGYGSGRTTSKQKAEQLASLEVNYLHHKGCLNLGTEGNLVWSRGGERIGQITYRAEQGRLVLLYNVRIHGGEWEPIEQHVNITYSSCNFGGKRPYLLCPGVVSGNHCGRRVGKLFAGGRYFLCRHCYQIAYGSQSEARYERMLRRANKLRIALGGEAGTANWIAPKPKGMWQRTYERTTREIEWCEGQADCIFTARFAHLTV